MSVDFYAGIWVEDEKYGRHLTWVKELVDDAVNISNHSASIMLRLMGFDIEELVGHMSISDLRKMAELLDNPDLQEKGYDIQEPGKARIISIGIDIDRLRGYADRLERLADLAEQYEADLIYWAQEE